MPTPGRANVPFLLSKLMWPRSLVPKNTPEARTLLARVVSHHARTEIVVRVTPLFVRKSALVGCAAHLDVLEI